MNVRLHHVLSATLAAACCLSTAAGTGAASQDKTTDADLADKIYSSSQVDVKAVIKLREEDIPSGIGCKETQGLALLRAVLRKNGKVTDVEVRQKSGCESFDERAVKAIKKIRFTPAKKDGVAVSQYHVHQFTYRIR